MPMAAGEEILPELFTRLHAQISAGQRKRALKTVDEILKSSPKDLDALRTKAFLLVDLDRFADVLDLCEKGGLSSELGYEKAYCLYRLGELDKSLEILDLLGSKSKEEAHLQLRAQLQYRLGHFKAAIQTYEELYKHHKVSAPEVKTNVAAAHAAAGDAQAFEATARSRSISAQHGFETAFNMACIKLHSNDLEEAKELLLLGIRSGRESLLEEDYTEEQVEQELAPLAVQLAFTSACLGDHHGALEQYKEILGQDLGDEGTRIVAINNSIAQQILTSHTGQHKAAIQEAIKQSESAFEKGTSLKIRPAVASRLSDTQQDAILTNRLLLLLSAKKHPVVRDALQQLLKRKPELSDIQTVRAALLIGEKKLLEADKVLQACSQENLGPQFRLLQAQLAVQKSEHDKAATLMSGVTDAELRSKPAFMTSLVAILEAAGKPDAALSLLKKASSAQTSSKAGKAATDVNLLPIMARLQLKTGAIDAALSSFQQLYKLDSSAASAKVVGQLATAALGQDPAAVSLLRSHLRDLSPLPDHVIEDLESAGGKRKAKRAAEQDDAAGAKKRKRKKRKRLPKDFDPENPGPPPDPERWLPKWQRAEFKRKRRSRKDKDKGKSSHQGGAVDESLDRTNTEAPAAAAPNLPKRARARGKAGRR